MSRHKKKPLPFLPGVLDDADPIKAAKALGDLFVCELMEAMDLGSAIADPDSEHGMIGQIIGAFLAYDGDKTGKVYLYLKDWSGRIMARSAADSNPEELSAFFARITKMKKRIAEPGAHRVARLVKLYFKYQAEFGFVPTKKKLREYACDKMPGCFPDRDALTLWTPLWAGAGLKELEEG